MGSLHKNIQLTLEFLKALDFPYCTLVTFLMMLSVILLSMLYGTTTLYSKCDQGFYLWQQLELSTT